MKLKPENLYLNNTFGIFNIKKLDQILMCLSLSGDVSA